MILSGAMFSFDKLNRGIGRVDKVPWIAEIMVTKWTYEALMVHQFKDNRFNKTFYEYDKKISQSDYKKVYWIPELRNRLKDVNEELNKTQSINKTKGVLKVIYNEIKKETKNVPEIKFDALGKINATSYNRGISRKVYNYLDELDEYYSKIFSRADKFKQKIINTNLENKPDVYYRFRDNYHSESVADIVKKVYETNKILEFQNELIQHFDPVYQDPVVKGKLDFRSHFFSPKKHFIGKYYDTYWFNICVVWILTIIFYITLYFDLLKKLITLSDRLKRRN